MRRAGSLGGRLRAPPQLRNVLHKTWLLKRRAPLGLCCELLVPLLVIGAMALGYMVSATSVVPAGNYEQVLQGGPGAKMEKSGIRGWIRAWIFFFRMCSIVPGITDNFWCGIAEAHL